jgi:hypothetical protein
VNLNGSLLQIAAGYMTFWATYNQARHLTSQGNGTRQADSCEIHACRAIADFRRSVAF